MTEDLEMELSALYKAAKTTLPDQAEIVASTAEVLENATAEWESGALLAGDPASLTDAIAINRQVHEFMARAVLTLNQGAITLVHVADDFAKTDAASAAESNKIQKLMDKKLDLADVPEPLEEDGR